MALQFTHARLLVSNYEACFLFYRDLLGFDVAWGNENEDYAEFSTGEIKLALFKRQLIDLLHEYLVGAVQARLFI